MFRPLTSSLDNFGRSIVKTSHCAGCVSLRGFASWPATLAYPYESDLLLWLMCGFGQEVGAETTRYACTALPVIPKRTLKLTDSQAELLGAFSVLVGWATASDHERDEGSALFRFMRARLDPYLEGALEVLSIPPGSPPDPRLLAELDETQCGTVDGLLALYQPFVGGLWIRAFEATEIPTLCSKRGIRIAALLSDVMLLADAWVDKDVDGQRGSPNPFSDAAKSSSEGPVILEEKLRALSLLVSGAKAPYDQILRAIFNSGVGARMSRLMQIAAQKGSRE